MPRGKFFKQARLQLRAYIQESSRLAFLLKTALWWSGLVVLSPPATEETGAMGREIESRYGICRVVVFFKVYNNFS
jgi:hypothetical protein